MCKSNRLQKSNGTSKQSLFCLCSYFDVLTTRHSYFTSTIKSFHQCASSMMIELYELLNVIQKCKCCKISANQDILFENHFDDWAKCLFFTSNKHVYFMVSGIFLSGSDHPAVIDCEGDCVVGASFAPLVLMLAHESMVVISA